MFNRAMDVRGVLAAGSVVANNMTVQGTLIARQIKSKKIRSKTMSVGELKTTRLSSPTGTIIIDGDLIITHSRTLEYGKKAKGKGKGKGKGKDKGKKKGKSTASAKPSPKGAASTKSTPKAKSSKKKKNKFAKGIALLAEEVVVGGIKQWALVRQDHFQNADDSNEWRFVGTEEPVGTSTCARANPNDRFLGGHCVLANGPARKIYRHLPPHSQVRVTARYHFIDRWMGETAFAQIDNQYVWTQTHRISASTASSSSSPSIGVGLDLCGSPQWGETRLSSPIDVSVSHNSDSLIVAFGAHSASSGARRSLAEENQLACDRSFGVDDVAIYVR
jgi:hypothetical protein